MSEKENYQFLQGVTNKLGEHVYFKHFDPNKVISDDWSLEAEKTQEKANIRWRHLPFCSTQKPPLWRSIEVWAPGHGRKHCSGQIYSSTFYSHVNDIGALFSRVGQSAR